MALKELIYTSVVTAPFSAGDVEDILSVSLRNNVQKDITGLLLFDGRRFIQTLEGPAECVDRLYEAIMKDTRHTMIECLHNGDIQARSFENWRMAFEKLPNGLLETLAEKMAVFSMELDGEPLASGESFGAKLDLMFMDAIATE